MTPRSTRTILAIASLGALLSTSARAQDVVTIDPALAQKHLIHKVEAQYPADAQAAQVQGTVTLRLSIDTTGRVTDAEVTAGPELLRQAAADAARQWVYKPFAVAGKAFDAAATVNVTFTLPAAGAPPPPAAAPAVAAAPVAAPPPAEAPAAASAMPQSVDTAPTPAAQATPAPAGFESATTSADPPPPAEARPAPTAKPVFEAGAPPVDAPAADAAGTKPVFESATPPSDTAPAIEATPAPPPAQPATPAPPSKPAFEAAAPVEAAPAAIPPAEVTAPAEAGSAATAGTPENFTPLSDQCHKLMAAHGDVNQLVTICGEMAAAAENFPPESHYIERRAAYVFDAAALLRAWKYPEAEAMAKRAVAVVEEGHDDVTGASAAYAVLGNAQALNGKLAEASKSLDTAESLERKALDAASPQQQPVYSTTLRTILLFHAETLDRMGNKQAAAAKRAEAANLLPVAGN